MKKTMIIPAAAERMHIGGWPKIFMAWPGAAAPAEYALPESFEDADQWDNAWIGRVVDPPGSCKGPGHWNRVDTEHSEGLWCCRQEGGGAATIYAPEITWDRGGPSLLVDLKRVGGISGERFDIFFGVQTANNDQNYGIRFYGGLEHDKMHITKDWADTVLKAKNLTADITAAWKTLTISWSAAGLITWSFDGDTDNVIDNTYTGGGIGMKSYLETGWCVDNFREAA